MYGEAQVPEDGVIRMPQKPGDNVSLVVSDRAAGEFQEMRFRVNITRGAIFDFVYDFHSLNNFMAARVEGRAREDGTGEDNGRLLCGKWRLWSIKGRYENEPDAREQEHSIRVVLKPKEDFAVIVDGEELRLKHGEDWEFDPSGKVGFMTEEGVVSVVDLEVDV